MHCLDTASCSIQKVTAALRRTYSIQARAKVGNYKSAMYRDRSDWWTAKKKKETSDQEVLNTLQPYFYSSAS